MFKNVRWLYKKLGTVDISSIGAGTVTSAISTLNSSKISCEDGFLQGKDAIYYKFSNGLLICVHTVYITSAITTQWGSMYESPTTDLGKWACEFVSEPYISVTSASNGSVGVGYNCLVQGVWDTTAKDIGKVQLMRPVSTPSQSYALDVVGIGFWKY